MVNKCLLGIILVLGFWSVPSKLPAYSYGPACQWIHLIGKVDLPAERTVRWPILLSVTYQLPGMKVPATLLTNYPLDRADFRFYLSGFREEMEGVLFIPPMFFFAREIIFRYYAKSTDGRWKSTFQQSTFFPPNIPQVDLPANRGKNYLCHAGIHLDPLKLQAHQSNRR